MTKELGALVDAASTPSLFKMSHVILKKQAEDTFVRFLKNLSCIVIAAIHTLLPIIWRLTLGTDKTSESGLADEMIFRPPRHARKITRGDYVY